MCESVVILLMSVLMMSLGEPVSRRLDLIGPTISSAEKLSTWRDANFKGSPQIHFQYTTPIPLPENNKVNVRNFFNITISISFRFVKNVKKI